ncbi:LAFA_0C10440g1_1 [Lachancea sp. 'fantastica']|nr:LAFA_0C10440g1_1 [Lachancea sp. 'fantastica']
MSSQEALGPVQKLTQVLVDKFMLLDDLLKGIVFGIGAVVVVILTAIILIKIMLMSQEGSSKTETEKPRATEKGNSVSSKQTAKSTSIASSAEEDDPHAHLLSRKVIPIESNGDYEEEMEISLMEED